MTQHVIQVTGLGVMIARCSPDSQHGKHDRHPTNAGCPFFRYTNENLSNHINQRRKHKTWRREAKQLALPCLHYADIEKEW